MTNSPPQLKDMLPAVQDLLHRVITGADADSSKTIPLETQQEVLSRIAWNALTEPNEYISRTLIDNYSGSAALTVLQSDNTAHEINQLLDAAGITVTQQLAQKAIERWQARLMERNLLELVRDTLQTAVKTGLRVLTPQLPGWPEKLSALGENQPILLWTKGDIETIKHRFIAVVGARALTPYGETVTNYFTEYLCKQNLGIISGGAYGADGLAHRIALNHKTPTIAVLAGGIDRPYPSGHTELFRKIVDTGNLIVTEAAPGSAPTRWRFLLRNRLIAALSEGVLVTEAGMRSGSINTANHAAELGIPLGAIPGSVMLGSSAGAHQLIRDHKAELIANTTQLDELLHLQETTDSTENTRNIAHLLVLDALPLTKSAAVEQIASRAGISHKECTGILAELELLGKVTQEHGKWPPHWRLVRE
ncbi:DNA-processing protein DprA [Canibacter zhoujuaniae]|uniref:DNA-processing protein DprA n=1 Tax=Canibacter zhoujuaniae TaxID=2708343 RepID=UPI00142028FD|nr:DNA-processing protein DprA [Canibacter zhoujuaniae]